MGEAVRVPLVMLLADDPKSARALGLLLSDWGYKVTVGAAPDGPEMAAGHGARPVAIIADLAHAGCRATVETALMLRARIASNVPILICDNEGRDMRLDMAAPAVTLLRKPADPAAIRQWLESLNDISGGADGQEVNAAAAMGRAVRYNPG